MVLLGELKVNYAVNNFRSNHAEYNSLLGTVGKALAEADAQLETQVREFIQVARQRHAVDAEEEQIQDFLFSTVAEQVPTANLFRIKIRFSRFVRPYPLA